MEALDRITGLDHEEEIEQRRGYTWPGRAGGSVLHGGPCCHLQEEKVVTAKLFSLHPVANLVNVPKFEKDVTPLT
jgi:hypothetical protein